MTFIPIGDGTTFIAVDRWGAAPACRADGDASTRFRPGTVAARLLSHAHADHTAGLDDDWAARGGDGPSSTIYASPATAGFLSAKWPGLAGAFRALRPGDELKLFSASSALSPRAGAKRGRGGGEEEEAPSERVLLASVHALDANHCPGSLMFLIVTPAGGAYLHTGDCRFEGAALRGLVESRRGPLAAVLGASAAAAAARLGPPRSPPSAAAAPPQGLSFLFLDATYGARTSLVFPSRAAVAGTILAAVRAGPAGLRVGGRKSGGGGGGSSGGSGGRGAAPPSTSSSSSWAEVVVAMDAIGREELLAALAAGLGVPARAGAARVAAAVSAGLPAGAFTPDDASEGTAGPMVDGSGGPASPRPPLLRALARRRVGAFVRACGGRGAEEEEQENEENEEEEDGGGGSAPRLAGPTLLILPSSLHLLKPGYWAGRLRGVARAEWRPATAGAPGAAAAAGCCEGLSLATVAGAPGLTILEAPYSLHSSFEEAAALAAALGPVGVVATGTDADAVRRRLRGREGSGQEAAAARRTILEEGLRPLTDAIAAGMGCGPGQGPGVSVGGDYGWVGGAEWLY